MELAELKDKVRQRFGGVLELVHADPFAQRPCEDSAIIILPMTELAGAHKAHGLVFTTRRERSFDPRIYARRKVHQKRLGFPAEG